MPDAGRAPGVISIEDVRAAARGLRGVAHRTPVLTCSALDELIGARVLLKCENFQRVGAFKFRGAYNAMSRLGPEEKGRGVLAYSSGNHAQGIALAGRLLGVRTVIVMPSDAPELKLRATRGYLGPDSEVVVYDRVEITRESLGGEIAERQGLTVIPPYDHPDVIAGQGTVALELFEEAHERHGAYPDEFYVCTGGGGLLSGCAITAKALAPACRVVGVEPERAADAQASFESGVLHTVRDPDTIADGARTPYLGRWTFPLVRAHADAIDTVPDEDLVRMMRFCAERMKIVVEPSGVLGLAGLVRRAADGRVPRGALVGVVLSGGNTDPARFGGYLTQDLPAP